MTFLPLDAPQRDPECCLLAAPQAEPPTMDDTQRQEEEIK